MKHLVALLLVVAPLAAADAREPARPNILLIVSDDHGYADVGFNGCKDIPTPHLDRLARGGLICTNGYVTHPFCSPTRAALLTGRYQQRFGHENTPLRDGKGSVYEGGVHVPFVVSWPGTLPAGRRYEPAVSSLDVFATALARAGVPMPADRTYDSVDLLPFLTGARSGPPHDRLFWRAARGQWAVRASEGSWKIVRQGGQPDELYRLAADLGEADNLAAAEPARLRGLTTALDAWNKELIPPAFPGAASRRQGKGAGMKAGAPPPASPPPPAKTSL